MDKNLTTKSPSDNVISFMPTAEFYYHKAMKALDRSQFDQGKKYLNRALELNPKDAVSLVQLAFLKMEEEAFSEALDLLQRANVEAPNDPETILFLAETCANIGLAEDAIQYAKHYLDLAPRGEYREEAEEIIEIVSEMLQEEPLEDMQGSAEKNIEQERARHLMETGEFDKAIEILENVIAEYPDFWSAYNNLALAYFYQGEHEQARALLHEVLIGNYGNIHAICNLAVIAHYEQDEEEVNVLKQSLCKIQPYYTEHRYKLGATLALIGEYEHAYKWLNSLKKKGYIGDPGFYFWLSHAAYFSGFEKEARDTWKLLLEIDPTKEGLEPWSALVAQLQDDALVNDRDFIIDKLKHELLHERMMGLFLLSKSGYRKDILGNPAIIDIDELSTIEKLLLAYAMNSEFSKDPELQSFYRGVEVLEILYDQHQPFEMEDMFVMQLWIVLFEKAIHSQYAFEDPTALAAATEYLFLSIQEKIDTKEVAKWFGTTEQSLEKSMEDLLEILPEFGETD